MTWRYFIDIHVHLRTHRGTVLIYRLIHLRCIGSAMRYKIRVSHAYLGRSVVARLNAIARCAPCSTNDVLNVLVMFFFPHSPWEGPVGPQARCREINYLNPSIV